MRRSPVSLSFSGRYSRIPHSYIRSDGDPRLVQIAAQPRHIPEEHCTPDSRAARAVDVQRTVVDEEALRGIKLKALQEALKDLVLRLEQLFIGRDDEAPEALMRRKAVEVVV